MPTRTEAGKLASTNTFPAFSDSGPTPTGHQGAPAGSERALAELLAASIRPGGRST
ncbi:MAG: hypothetical protein ACLQUY_21705 [Ktedonobacterales bacterium]